MKNNQKECTYNCWEVQPYGFVPEAWCPIHDKQTTMTEIITYFKTRIVTSKSKEQAEEFKKLLLIAEKQGKDSEDLQIIKTLLTK